MKQVPVQLKPAAAVAAFVVLFAGFAQWRNWTVNKDTCAATTATEGDWNCTATIAVPANPDGVWTVALPYLKAGTLFRIRAEGQWSLTDRNPNMKCGPNGLRVSHMPPGGRILGAAPAGSLIGKIGGSTADTIEGSAFCVGSMFVGRVPTEKEGLLFLTTNVSPTALNQASGELQVTVDQGAPR